VECCWLDWEGSAVLQNSTLCNVLCEHLIPWLRTLYATLNFTKVNIN
jgi:hypothetical protein